jgi:methyltransferase (TIGR00027 family)
MHDYLAARTAFFDRVVLGAVDRGVRQVVVGAAGYDGRAFRYAKPGVRWFEVDHPATQRDKLARLGRLGIDASRVRFVGADFRTDPVAELLLGAGLDPGSAALFLLEGVAVYLEPAVLSSLLAQLRQVAAPGSRMAISVSLSLDHDRAARARFEASVAAMGEPARSTFDAEEAEALLARAGWQVTPPAGPDEAARHQRRRSTGLLLATAASLTAAPPAAAAQKSRQPHQSSQSHQALPLSALLSQALVAFTIEFDNEAEHRIPHRTTSFGADGRDVVWLVSLAMWENCMRFVGDNPITVRELLSLARTRTNLDGMRRWGYITIDGTSKKIHKSAPGPDAVLRATPKGLMARQVWQPLAGLIDQRWQERYGADQIGHLRHSLQALVSQLDPGLPDCLPILGPDLHSPGPGPDLHSRGPGPDLHSRGPGPDLHSRGPGPELTHTAQPTGLPLSALLSRALLAFALDYEAASQLSLAVGANLLRVLDAEGIRLRDLPASTGISKEAVRWALGVLLRARLAVEEPDPAASRGKVARLTPKGLHAQRTHRDLMQATEATWRDRFGADTLAALRQPLDALATSADAEPPPLFRALEPYPENWRAKTGPPATLPHYPMVLHRGGYPDGS